MASKKTRPPIPDPFSVDYSPTDRAICKGCDGRLAEGSLRLLKKVWSPWHDGFDLHKYHLRCGAKFVKNLQEVTGWQRLRWDDVRKVVERFGESLQEKHPVVESYKRRSHYIWQLADLLQEVPKKQLLAILDANEIFYNEKKVSVIDAAQWIADGIFFGRLPQCPICGTRALVQEGCVVRCRGYMPESSTRCCFRYTLQDLLSPSTHSTATTNASTGVEASALTRTELFVLPPEAQRMPLFRQWKAPTDFTEGFQLGNPLHALQQQKRKATSFDSEAENEAAVPKKQELAGLQFASIGATNPPKQQLAKMITSHGGLFDEALDPKTDFLLVHDEDPAAARHMQRYQDALLTGVPIMRCGFVSALISRKNVQPAMPLADTKKKMKTEGYQAVANSLPKGLLLRQRKYAAYYLVEGQLTRPLQRVAAAVEQQREAAAAAAAQSKETIMRPPIRPGSPLLTPRLKRSSTASLEYNFVTAWRLSNNQGGDYYPMQKRFYVTSCKQYHRYAIVELDGYMHDDLPPANVESAETLSDNSKTVISSSSAFVCSADINGGGGIVGMMEEEEVHSSVVVKKEAKRIVKKEVVKEEGDDEPQKKKMKKVADERNVAASKTKTEKGGEAYDGVEESSREKTKKRMKDRKEKVTTENEKQKNAAAAGDGAAGGGGVNKKEEQKGEKRIKKEEKEKKDKEKKKEPGDGDDRAKTKKLDLTTNVKVEPKSKLHPAVQQLIKTIFDTEMAKKALKEQHLNLQRMPIHSISRRQLNEGYAVLQEIQRLLQETGEQRATDRFKIKIADATNRFYNKIPHVFERTAVPPVIDTFAKLRAKVEMMEQLLDVCVAQSLIKGALKDTPDLHPLDAQYEQLRCTIEPVERSSEEWKLIETMLVQTRPPTHNTWSLQLQYLFRCSRSGERQHFDASLGDRRLLWHGSRLTNWPSVIAQGLKIAPPEAPSSGYMFGKGLYFADMASKSSQYCFASSKEPHGLMVVAEVALGKTLFKLEADDHADAECVEKGYDSVWGVGKSCVDPKGDVLLDSAVDQQKVLAKTGSCVSNRASVEEVKKKLGTDTDPTLLYNEYVVYRTNQVLLRYLVQVKFEFATFDLDA